MKQKLDSAPAFVWHLIMLMIVLNINIVLATDPIEGDSPVILLDENITVNSGMRDFDYDYPVYVMVHDDEDFSPLFLTNGSLDHEKIEEYIDWVITEINNRMNEFGINFFISDILFDDHDICESNDTGSFLYCHLVADHAIHNFCGLSVRSENKVYQSLTNAENCLNPTGIQYTWNALYHELGHTFKTPTGPGGHTFTSNINCYSAIWEPNPTGGTTCELVARPDEDPNNYNCDVKADRSCSTNADPKMNNDRITVHYGMTAYNYRYDPNNVNNCCISTINNSVCPNDGIYGDCNTDDFVAIIDNTLSVGWGAGQRYHISNVRFLNPCEYIAQLHDVNGDVYHPDPRNIMSYTGEGCAEYFTEEQIDAILQSQIDGINVADKIRNLVVADESEFGSDIVHSLDEAFEYIMADYYTNYRIFVKDSYVGHAEDEIVVYTNEFRKLSIDIIGVNEVYQQGGDYVWTPQHAGVLITSYDSDVKFTFNGNIDLKIENLKFTNFANGRQIGYFSTEALVIDFNGSMLSMENCYFFSNGLNSSLLDTGSSCKGVIDFSPVIDPKLSINNCLFSDNRSPGGPAVVLSMSGIESAPEGFAEITQTTFANNFFLTGAQSNGVMHIQALGTSIVKNCIFSGSDPQHGTPGNQPEIDVDFGDPREMGATIENCLFDQEQWIASYLQELSQTNIVIPHAENPGYVNSENSDYRLRWDSVCMDAGEPNLPIDFDLTRADIGWTPTYPEIEISGTTSINQRGWYKVVGTTTFTDADLVIPEGTTIRCDDGHSMFFRDTDSTNGYNIIVGNPDGARTAIVGSTTGGSIVFGTSSTAPNQAATSFDGVLFNRAPDFYNGALWFAYCDVDLNGADGNVKFNAYQNTEVVFDAVCYGQYRNFDFSASHITDGIKGIGCVDVQYSDVDVIGNVFDRTNFEAPLWYWKLMHYGTVANPNHIIANNWFESQDNLQMIVPVLLGGATINLHHNAFNDVEAGAISAASASLNMRNGANNQFIKEDVLEYNAYPFIDGTQTYSDLECGYNVFVADNYAPSYDFVVSSHGSHNWSYNFWGSNCGQGQSPEGHIPSFVTDFIPWLETCPTSFVPCEGQVEENELYSLGWEAAEIQNHEAAVANWIEMMQDYPESKYCTEVTGIVKSIGLYTEHGAENYGEIRAGLEGAAVKSESVDDLLSIYQVCSAWCVEAMHGDRPVAVDLLDSLLVEKDGYAKAELLINTALAEIATYPEQGQMNALGPEAEQQRLARRHQALRNLQRVLVPALASAESHSPNPQHEQEGQPAMFGLSSCHPNPFNPTTILEVQVVGEEALTLEIYNTLGQRMAVLHQGPLPAGIHQFHWTAGQAASGVYLARATQGQRMSVKKMLLIR